MQHNGQSDISALMPEWESLLDEFRALGGVADNVTLGRGAFGRGLFAPDPTKPYLLRLPNNLLFPVEEVEFIDQRIRIKEGSIPQRERAFFERYQQTFSWGGGGKSESETLIDTFDTLPPAVRTKLANTFQLGSMLQGDPLKRARARFLQSRIIDWNGRNVIMPLIELANCDTAASGYEAGENGLLQIKGRTEGEILVDYGPHDSFRMFEIFGFATARPMAYSIPAQIAAGTMKLNIGWDPGAKTARGNLFIPKMSVDDKTISLSYLLLGHTKLPRVSRGTFGALMKEAGVKEADEAFDTILRANRRAFLDLLELLEPYSGNIVVMLRRAVHFQLEAMTHCVGTRDL